jgi:hypothetical protein
MQCRDRANSRPAKLRNVHQQPTPLEGNLEGNSSGILKVVLIPQEVTSQFGSSPGDPVIHLCVDLELEPRAEPQNIYFAFPLALDEGWEAAFDTAGTAVRLDVDQLPGACCNWATAGNYAAIWDKNGGVALFLE